MSAALGALTIAIATEFGVILAARFHEERRRRAAPPSRRCAAPTPAPAPPCSPPAVTAIAGFAALIASDVRMLRDFGFVTVIDLAVALLGVMVVLPAPWSGWRSDEGPLLARSSACSSSP